MEHGNDEDILLFWCRICYCIRDGQGDRFHREIKILQGMQALGKS